MKKAILILTMLVATVGVSFRTNAQGETLPYTMDVDNVTPDWTDVGTDANWLGTNNAAWQFPETVDGDVEISKSFDLSSMDSIQIDLDITSDPSYTVEMEIYIDVYDTSPDASYTLNGSANETFMFTNSTSFASSTNIYFILKYIGTGVNSINTFIIEVNSFSITGYENTGSVGINENDLSNTLEVYSFDKSIFISSNETMDADVSVYNMNGQLLNTQNLKLSNAQTELSLQDVQSGIYFIQIQSGKTILKKKLFIK
ncbi:MAG: T9SS type A sorting domain-containing protein [Crocinitomicaceae bacterium]